MPNLLAIGKDWWLPPNYSVHGRETDALFYWFFWITFVILVIVQILLVVFLVKYRNRPGRRATFIHGNSRLEMLWTAIPAVILAVLALGSKRVWDDYRNSPDLNNPDRTTIMVIGEQFAWNVVYPGPDGKIGKYLVYPKPTDKYWPPVDPAGTREIFEKVDGPASMSPKAAATAISKWINQDNEHRLGKDFSDAYGVDDVVLTPKAPIEVPVNRPVEVLLESKDVIHDFYLPNFRAQLYAVPGMRGDLVFTPTITTAERERASYETVDVASLIDGSGDRVIGIDASTPGAVKDAFGWRFARGKGRQAATIVRDGKPLMPAIPATPDTPAKPATTSQLLAAGITRVTLYTPSPFEIVCAQLCGEQHSTMRGVLIVLPQAEFDQKHPASPHVPSH
jgi:heme/copper-type cytochrome/quinol oxidase subunit 2